MKSIILGILLGIGALAVAPHIRSLTGPIPLCPPDQPNCDPGQKGN